MEKSDKIIHLVTYLQAKYGASNILLKDYWDADVEAIGFTEKSEQYLVYISTLSDKENDYYIALENPPADKDLPYSSAGEFKGLSLNEVEEHLIRHLRLRHI